jgi:hypothetical protein
MQQKSEDLLNAWGILESPMVDLPVCNPHNDGYSENPDDQYEECPPHGLRRGLHRAGETNHNVKTKDHDGIHMGGHRRSD